MKQIFIGLLMLVFFAAFYSVCFAQQAIKAVPLYELYGNSGHFYTTSETELNTFVNLGYAGAGTAGYVYEEPVPGTVPLYRYEGKMAVGLRQFFTISKKKGDDAVQSGYKYVGVCCYVAAKQENGAVPFYRLYQGQHNADDKEFTNQVGDDHFYTTDENQKNNAVNNLGYVLEGNEGYIWKKQTSFTAPMSPAARAEQYEQMLFNEGCTKTSGNQTQIACTSEIGYFNCEIARTKNFLKISKCVPPATHQEYQQIDQKLTALNCEHFLGRPGQYLCQNVKGADLCDSYMKQPNSPITKCLSIKGTAISKDLLKRGCDHFLGRPDEYLCKNDDAYKACENYRLDGEVKKCVSTKKNK